MELEIRQALKSQYHATLAMLRDVVVQCPDEIWAGGDFINPTWRIAYHTLFYTHLYLQPTVHAFTPWEHHQTSMQDMDDRPAPPGIFELIEHPHLPPQTGVPYTREQILEYCSLVDAMVDGALDAMDLHAADCGFSWYSVSKLEHQFVAIRHIQHHTAQLGSRLREATNGDVTIKWVHSGAAHD